MTKCTDPAKAVAAKRRRLENCILTEVVFVGDVCVEGLVSMKELCVCSFKLVDMTGLLERVIDIGMRM